MRQGQSAVDIAYRIQAIQVGMYEAIRHDFSSRAEFDARILQTHAMGVRTPADRNQHTLGTGHDLVVCKGDHAIRNGRQAFHCAFVDEFESAPAHFTLDNGGDIAVDEGQGALAHGDERDLYAKRIHDERILARHDAVPDDKQESGQRIPMHQIVAGHHAGTVGHEAFRQYRAGTCTNQYGIRLDHTMARHFHVMPVQDASAPLYMDHPAVRHQAVDTGIEQVDHLACLRTHCGPIRLYRSGHAQAIGLGTTHLLKQVANFHQGLGRDAAAMQARSPQRMRIDQCHLRAFCRGMGRRHITCRAAADNRDMFGHAYTPLPSIRPCGTGWRAFSNQAVTAPASINWPLRVTWPLTSIARTKETSTGLWLSTVSTSFFKVSISAGLSTSVSKMIF